MSEPIEILDGLNPLERLSRDVVKASKLLSLQEIRYLVDSYYSLQEYRKATANQELALSKSEEPPEVIIWLRQQTEMLETQIKRVLDKWTDSHPTSTWAKCAPPGSMVLVENGRWGKSGGKCVPIEELRNGDGVATFDRRRARIGSPKPIKVGTRSYVGNLISVTAGDCETRTTPNHKWLVRLEANQEAAVVYMMRRGPLFRIGWCSAMSRETDRKNGRLRLRSRARKEKAEQVWILKLLPSKKEASIYESLIATTYGLPLMPFEQIHGSTYYDGESIAAFFSSLDLQVQLTRAMQCLYDHGLSLDAPLISDIGYGTKESVAGLVLYASNLVPGMMSLPVPLRGGGVEWKPIQNITRTHYSGPVYSLDVAEDHKYIQDGLGTCNSITGIGPVISAGLAAHIDIKQAPTAGHIWSFAGLNPMQVWEKGGKRPWNASLKTLCWKIGESFVKVSGNANDVYGKLYLKRKEEEMQRNEAGALAEQAAAKLEKFKIGKTTDAYKAYSSGKLPPAHIHARAKRYAVKMFLSHYHAVAWELQMGTKPPKPWVHEFGGHAHYIAPPNWPMK